MQERISATTSPPPVDLATPPPLVIRRLQADDAALCARIYRRAYEAPPYQGAWDEPTAERIIRDILRLFPEECFVAEQDGVLRGFILCSSLAGMRATVEEFAVAPEYQEQGIGRALLRHVLDHFRRHGLAFIELVANRTAPAYHFYRHEGFAESDEYRLMSREL